MQLSDFDLQDKWLDRSNSMTSAGSFVVGDVYACGEFLHQLGLEDNLTQSVNLKLWSMTRYLEKKLNFHQNDCEYSWSSEICVTAERCSNLRISVSLKPWGDCSSRVRGWVFHTEIHKELILCHIYQHKLSLWCTQGPPGVMWLKKYI